jgi:selenocysteine lyase/cysteine desulfurase
MNLYRVHFTANNGADNHNTAMYCCNTFRECREQFRAEFNLAEDYMELIEEDYLHRSFVPEEEMACGY